jgi:hypothetical protein
LLVNLYHLLDAQLSQKHFDLDKLERFVELQFVHLPCFLVRIHHRKQTVLFQLESLFQVLVWKINLAEVNQRVNLWKAVEILKQPYSIFLFLVIVPVKHWVSLAGQCCFEAHLGLTSS